MEPGQDQTSQDIRYRGRSVRRGRNRGYRRRSRGYRGRGGYRGRRYRGISYRGRGYRGRGYRGRGRGYRGRVHRGYNSPYKGYRASGRGYRGAGRVRGRGYKGRGRGKVYKVDPSKWINTQFLYESDVKKNKYTALSSSSFEFAKYSIAYFGDGAVISKIICSNSKIKGQAVHISWLNGTSSGNGRALFEGDGSALLAVEILKKSTFNNKKINITDPKKDQNGKDGIYFIELSNLPLHFDNEILTKSLSKLHLENFLEANIIYNDNNNNNDDQIVITQLKSLLHSYNLIELKCHPLRNGICTSTAILKTMNNCLKLIRETHNQFIDFGVSNGKIKIALDLRTVIELESNIWDILRPEMQKLWSIIRWDPLQFYGIKVFLIPIHKSKSDKARIVIIGTNPSAVMLTRNLYNKLIKPLIFKYDNKCKCRLIYKYLKTKQFINFKCCVIKIFIQSNTIKIYAKYDIKNIFQKKISEFEKSIQNHNIVNVTPFIIRKCLKPRMPFITKYGDYGVYVNMDVGKRLVQVIYCSKITNEMKNDDDNDQPFIESNSKGKECIEYIETLLKDFKQSKLFKPQLNNNNASTQLLCGICTMDIEKDEEIYKLKSCHHKFHLDCIQMQLNSACEPNGTRPIQCASALCNKNVVLSDIKCILNNDNKYKQLLIYSINDNVKINPNKYKYCPTPDCKQIYLLQNKCDDDNKDNDDIKYNNDNIFNCTECLKQYCLNCNIEYHFGKTCKEFKNISNNNNDNDESLKIFLNKYNSNNLTQNCPNCGIITDKLPDTCNHAECVYCNAHFCWKCLWMDKNNNKDGNLVYKHMQSQHGGYYG